MIKNAYFMSQSYAEGFKPGFPSAIISITNPGSEKANFEGIFEDILRISFNDFKTDDGRGVAFNLSHAAIIRDFVAKIQGMPREMDLIVHCTQGSSRSAAVAQWVGEILSVPVRGRPSDIGTRMANTLVLAMLRSVLNDK